MTLRRCLAGGAARRGRQVQPPGFGWAGFLCPRGRWDGGIWLGAGAPDPLKPEPCRRSLKHQVTHCRERVMMLNEALVVVLICTSDHRRSGGESVGAEMPSRRQASLASSEADEPMGELRIIKKYPNRRLYDTAVSSYITLEDVRELVLSHTIFSVRDAKSDEDITRNILLQIIIEQEEGGKPIFTNEVLEQVIRFYGDTLQSWVATYLDRSMKLFVDQQSTLRERMKNVVVGDPLGLMRELTEKNISVWKDVQEGIMKAAVPSGRRGSGKKKSGVKDEKNTGESTT